MVSAEKTTFRGCTLLENETSRIIGFIKFAFQHLSKTFSGTPEVINACIRSGKC